MRRRIFHRLHGERGANLVEFAVVLPVLIVILFGIVEFGIAYNNYISLRQGARDAARQAVVADYSTAPASCSTTSGATGQTLSLICLAKERTDINPSSSTAVRVEVPTSGSVTVGEPITVCTQHPLSSVTGLFSFLNGKMLKTEVQMRAEQTSSLENKSDTDTTGDNWSWCG